MFEKILSLAYVLVALLANDAVKDRHSGYLEIMQDPMFYIILISGIMIALFVDHKDPNVEVKKPVTYFIFSFFACILLSGLAAALKVQSEIGWFYFYCLIAGTTTLSPAIVRKLTTTLPDKLADTILNAIPDFFSWGFNKFSNHKKKEDE